MDVAMRENSAIYLEDNYQQKYEGFDDRSWPRREILHAAKQCVLGFVAQVNPHLLPHLSANSLKLGLALISTASWQAPI